jgi:RimJ/RimL family protein N-acetyltransferase
MALFHEEFPLGNFTFTIRNAEPEDAERMIAHINQVDTESVFLTREPGEFSMSVEEEQTFLTRKRDSEFSLFLIAEVHGEIVASCEIQINSKKRLCHKGDLGIAVQKAYWSMGIGRKMMNAAIAWCRGRGLIKIELKVNTENQRALSLYNSLGFEIEGTIRKSVRLADGTFRDAYIMGLMLQE